MKQAGKAAPAPTTDAPAPKTGGAPAQDPGPQKETSGVSTLPKAQDESEDEIPLLVPVKETPAARSVEVFSLIFNIHHGRIPGLRVPGRHLVRDGKCYAAGRHRL